MSSTKYKYRFTIDDIAVYPVFDEGASLRYERDDVRVFLRLRLNGTFILTNSKRKEFNLVWAKDLDHKFVFKAQFMIDGVVEDEINGEFYKTDCQFDEDNSIVRVVVETIDKYDKIMKGMDKEFDLIKLGAPTYSVRYKKEPMLQVVFRGDSVLSHQIGGTSFITDMGTVYSGAELIAFGFRQYFDDIRVFIPGSGDMSPDVGGIYVMNADVNSYTRTDGLYVLTYDLDFNFWAVNLFGDATLLYKSDDGVEHLLDNSPFARFMEMTNQADPTAASCTAFHLDSYERVLTDVLSVGGVDTIPLPDDDIGGIEFHYDNYIDTTADFVPYAVISPTDEHTVVPTEYGRYTEDALHFAGEYFNPNLNPFPTTRAYTLMQSRWLEYALTIFYEFTHLADLIEAASDEVVNHAHKLEDVLKYVLAELDSAVTFNATNVHSNFLFDSINPITTEAQALTHFITQKSNIVNGDYDSPATKAPFKLLHIEELLMNGPNLFWWIDNNYNFRIEHLHYFKNGRSYDAPFIGIDLTTQIEPKTQKAWAYHTKRYKYRKDLIPEELRFSWMDDVSDYFDGFPIKILSNFAEKGNFADKPISYFTSDLTFTQAATDLVSLDGLFVLAAEFVEETQAWTVPYEHFDVLFFDDVILQNGFWSFYYLHDKFWRHYLPAREVNLNNADIIAISTKRTKEQDKITYPAPIHPDPMRLIRTSIGDGEMAEMEINLTSRKAVITPLHDLDFDNPCPTC